MKQIAITFDDLPYADRKASLKEVRSSTARILRVLRGHKVRATGFVNEDRLSDTGRLASGVGVLRMWLTAGMELGNHSYGHVGLQETPLDQAEDAVVKGETYTRPLMASYGKSLRYYRHPFTQTGPTLAIKHEFEGFLAAHGYIVAPFTVEHDDYVFSLVYEDDARRGDRREAALVRQAYIHHLDEAVDTFETMSQELFNRQITQILLIHASRLNANTLSKTLERLEQRGYKFVSLEAALADPAYRSPDGYVGPAGPSWLLRWSRGLHRKTTVGGQPDPIFWVQKRYDQLVAAH